MKGISEMLVLSVVGGFRGWGRKSSTPQTDYNKKIQSVNLFIKVYTMFADKGIFSVCTILLKCHLNWSMI